MELCPHCNAPIEGSAKFCTHCGKPLAASTSAKYKSTFGQIPNREIMLQAKEALSGRWGLAIGVMLLYQIILGVTDSAFTPFVALVITGPMNVGLAVFSLSLSRRQDARLEQLFAGFERFGTNFIAYLLYSVFVFLWFLLLIIPGIIAMLSYSQTFYILAEDKNIGAYDAIMKSKDMMNGYRWKYFCLGLRFIGWWILCILTFGIGFLWLMPYMSVSCARFYDDVSDPRHD